MQSWSDVHIRNADLLTSTQAGGRIVFPWRGCFLLCAMKDTIHADEGTQIREGCTDLH